MGSNFREADPRARADFGKNTPKKAISLRGMLSSPLQEQALLNASQNRSTRGVFRTASETWVSNSREHFRGRVSLSKTRDLRVHFLRFRIFT